MASPLVPAKSQSLHNFNLPQQLKWNKDGHSSAGKNQRRRSTVKSPSRRPNNSSSTASPLHRSTSHDSVSTAPFRNSDSPIRGDSLRITSPICGESSKKSPICEPKKDSSISRSFQRRDLAMGSEVLSKSKDSRPLAFNSMNLEQVANKQPEKKSKAKEIIDAETKRSKILIKLPCKNNNNNNKLEEENPKKIETKASHNEAQEEVKSNTNNVDEDAKIWNLRPRKPLSKSKNVNGAAEKSKSQSSPAKTGQKEGNSGSGGEKKQKRKLSVTIALSKQEIEEDIYALTGSKPARRSKKRARNVQKQVDAAFPGLWLVSISTESYKVSENSMKG